MHANAEYFCTSSYLKTSWWNLLSYASPVEISRQWCSSSLRKLTGGAAKSIQLINVAAVVAVAAAVVAAGLASPAATHHMKKLRVWRKTVLFFSFFQFF